MVTRLPPAAGPVNGATTMREGATSVITSAPATIEASDPRFTARFLGPNGVAGEIKRFIDALVGAAEEILPPNAGEPRTRPGLETENDVPAVMSSPPTVKVPLLPRGTRGANAGRVRFKPVALLGRV